MKKFLFEALMLFHLFVLVKIPVRFISVFVLALEVLTYYAFVRKFKTQFLSKW